jgi:peptidyl-prolyl cis-trans isomerase SurA
MKVNKIKNFVIAFIILLNGLLLAQQRVDGIAAVVGNEIILLSEINSTVAQYAIKNKLNLSNNPQLYTELSKKALQNGIDEKLLSIKADEDTIKADEDRVDQALNQQIDYMVQQVGSMEKLEEYYGAPIAKIKKDLRKQIEDSYRIDLLKQRRFGGMKISRREVEDFYQNYSDSLPTLPPTVDISHILIQLNPSEESLQEAYSKIEKIKKMLQDGADFAELAKKYSEDPGTASRGGDLGFVNRGDFVKEFEEVAFALKEGEISDIVQTQFGFHIIQLLEKKGEKIHARHILVQLKPTQKDEELVIQKLNEIRNKLINGEATFEEMALQYSDDPNVKEDKGHLGKYRTDSFQIKAFETVCDTLSPGEISHPFKTEFGYHIVKLHSREEERKVSLRKDWEQIEQLALQFKSEREFKEWLASLREEIPVEIKINL